MRFIAMPTIDLTDEEHGAVTAAIRHLVEEDKPPHHQPQPVNSRLN